MFSFVSLYLGAILGMSHSIPQVLNYRPSIRSDVFKNLYFVGASVHPGTGVPIVLCGAKLVQRQILKDYGFVERDYEDMIIITQFILFGFTLIALFLWIFYYLL